MFILLTGQNLLNDFSHKNGKLFNLVKVFILAVLSYNLRKKKGVAFMVRNAKWILFLFYETKDNISVKIACQYCVKVHSVRLKDSRRCFMDVKNDKKNPRWLKAKNTAKIKIMKMTTFTSGPSSKLKPIIHTYYLCLKAIFFGNMRTAWLE